MRFDWKGILATLLGTASLVAAVGWLAQVVIKQVLEVDLETRKAVFSQQLAAHEAALKATGDQQLARFQSEPDLR